MKNVTITLDEDLAAWARVEAARQGKSLSRFLADTLREKRAPAQGAPDVLEAFLSGPGYPGVAGQIPSRDEIYDRPALLRHERAGLQPGSGDS